MNFKARCKELEAKIQDSYTSGVTLEVAEQLSGEFLHAMIQTSEELKNKDLDARMRKTGVKAVKAAIYTEACSKADKKPTESALEHMINLNDVIQSEQNALDEAESTRDELERYYNIFREAHVFFRGVAKGKFE